MPGYGGRRVKDDEYVGSEIRIDMPHYMVHEGASFSCQVSDDDLDTAEAIVISFKTPADKHIHLLWYAKTSAEAVVTIQEACVMSTSNANDAVLTCYNKKRVGTPTATTLSGHSTDSWVAGSATSGGTIATPGTVIETIGIGAGNKTGAVSNALDEWILKPATVYAVILTSSADNNVAQLVLRWYEVEALN